MTGRLIQRVERGPGGVGVVRRVVSDRGKDLAARDQGIGNRTREVNRPLLLEGRSQAVLPLRTTVAWIDLIGDRLVGAAVGRGGRRRRGRAVDRRRRSP